MSGIEAMAGIAFLVIFLLGVFLGVIVIVARSFNREDKRKSLKTAPPDMACGGTRRLVGVSRRDYQPRQVPQFPDDEPRQGRGRQR